MTTTSHTQAAVAGCTEALNRCLALVAAVDDAAFAHAPEGHGSIGEHLRHCIDHFDCFVQGYDRGVVDYDARERDAALERNRSLAEARLRSLADAMERLHSESLDRPLTVLQTAAPDEPATEVGSTLQRELMFLSGHTVHHLALMVLLAERAGAAPSTELGVAYSTLAHRTNHAG